MKAVISITVVAASLMGLSSCGKLAGDRDMRGANGPMCTLLACWDGLEATIMTPQQTVPAGTYDLRIEVNGILQTCQVTVQGAATTKSGDCSEVAADWQDDHVMWLRYTSFRTDISTLIITVFRSGTVIAQREVHPVYETVYPNGEQCPGSCRAADSFQITLNL